MWPIEACRAVFGLHKSRCLRVKHRAWFDDFEEGLPWELTLVGRMEVGPYQDPKKIKVGKVGAVLDESPPWTYNDVVGVLDIIIAYIYDIYIVY